MTPDEPEEPIVEPVEPAVETAESAAASVETAVAPAPDETPDVLAAEYVLGTLDADEKARAEAQLATDPAFAAQVLDWERKLGPLHGLVASVEPPDHLWKLIAEKLGPQSAGMRLPNVAARPARIDPLAVSNVIDLSFRLKRWRTAAGGLGALAAGLAALLVTSMLGLLPTARPPADSASLPLPAILGGSGSAAQRLVAVLQKDAASPAFILTVDVASRSMTVRRVSAETPPGKSYELWLVSTDFPTPRSLGLVGKDEFVVGRPLMYASQTISHATYAVSEEPEGGSPTGFATGPIVYAGKLIETTPETASPPR